MKGEYPEHDKLAEVKDASHAIGAFLDMGLPELGLVLCDNDREAGRLHPTSRSIQSILATYFEIDQTKLDAEKDAMLERLRDMNKRSC
jgi:predicted RNA-binding protein (virulence factor B family)